jgi:hypothetical protein
MRGTYHFDTQSYKHLGDYHYMVPVGAVLVPAGRGYKTKAKVISTGSPNGNENFQQHHLGGDPRLYFLRPSRKNATEKQAFRQPSPPHPDCRNHAFSNAQSGPLKQGGSLRPILKPAPPDCSC